MRYLPILILTLCIPLGAASSGKKLRLATWNVHRLCQREPWEVQEKLNRLVRVITPLRASVLALQDVESPYLVRRLAAEADYPYCLGRPRLGLLSRYPILGYRVEAEGHCLEVHLDEPMPLIVMVCHFSRGDPARQAWQVAMRIYQLGREQPGKLLAVLADLETPDRLDSLRQVHLLDPFAAIPREERSSCDFGAGDRILLNPALAAWWVPGSARVFRHKSVEQTSDHFPLVVELQGRSPPQAKRSRCEER